MTLRDKLKALGKTEEEISQILTTLGGNTQLFEQIITTAASESTAAAAKLADAQERERKLNEFWTNDATPQINDAFSQKAQAEARAKFYETQVEEARKAGFLPAAAPAGNPANPNPANPNPANPNPVQPNANPVPGSPAFMTIEQATAALSEMSYLQAEHFRLFSEPLDIGPIMQEASQTRGGKARDVWMKKYNVEGKRKEIADAAQKKHDDAIREETTKKVTQEITSRFANENTRTMVPSRFPQFARDEKTGAPDKQAWTRPNRREDLRNRMHEQATRESVSTRVQ